MRVETPGANFSEDVTFVSGGEACARASRGLFEGRVLSLRYRVGRLLASGGMGLVYEGVHLLLGVNIAIKVLRPELAESEELRARFEQEARATAALQSDHVVRVLDAGRLESGLPFSIMERLEGADLQEVSRLCGAFSPRVAVAYARQACRGLSAAHAIGLIHRDIKPANLFVAAGGAAAPRIKVLDFGISKWTTGGVDDLYTVGSNRVLGSPAYLSPEQLADADKVDCRTDIWSLGVVLFEMLTGHCPFSRTTLAETCEAVLVDPIPSVLDLRSDLDPALARVVDRCLQRRPEARFASITHLERALSAVSANRHSPFRRPGRDNLAARFSGVGATHAVEAVLA